MHACMHVCAHEYQINLNLSAVHNKLTRSLRLAETQVTKWAVAAVKLHQTIVKNKKHQLGKLLGKYQYSKC